jgi:hypothetical protein
MLRRGDEKTFIVRPNRNDRLSSSCFWRILFCKIKMSTTNEPDLTQILDAIKLLVTSEGKIFGFIASCADLAFPPNRNLACTAPKNCGINFPGIILYY